MNPNDQLEQILAQILEREEAGDSDHSAIIDQHPQFADAIRDFLADREHLQLSDLGPEQVFGDQPTLATGATGSANAQRIRYFGDYELIAEIARGGMGVVYHARQTSLDRRVAVKMILSGALASESDVRRFRSEAESAARLDHPNIVPIYEIGEHEGQHYFSMALVDGRSVADVINDGPMKAQQAAELVQLTSQAVQYAHEQGVIHRDLKPSNILIDGNGKPKITDFGLAKRADQEAALTTTGDLLGTPGYMPPEQAQGKNGEAGAAADIYGLGAILYACLTGRPPFQAAGVIETVTQVIERDPVPPRQLNADVPVDLQVICLKCLHKDPVRRYRSAGALSDDLDRFLAGRPIEARPVSVVERAVKWIKRRPAIASLIAATILASTLGLAGIIWQWQQAVAARNLAIIAGDKETKARILADQRANEIAAAESRIRNELHNSNLIRGDMLLREGKALEAESLFWDEYMRSPGGDKRRAEWRLLQLYAKHPKVGSLDVQANFLVEGSGLILAAEKNRLHVLDQEDGRLIQTFESDIGQLFRPAISPDGRTIACGHLGSGEILVWNLNSPAAEPQAIISTRKTSALVGANDPAVRVGVFAAKLFMPKEQRRFLNNIQAMLSVIQPDLCFADNDKLMAKTMVGMAVWDLSEQSERAFFDIRRDLNSYDSTIAGLSNDQTTVFVEGTVYGRNLLFALDYSDAQSLPRLVGVENGSLVTFEIPLAGSNKRPWSRDGVIYNNEELDDEIFKASLLTPKSVVSEDGRYLVARGSGELTQTFVVIDLTSQRVVGTLPTSEQEGLDWVKLVQISPSSEQLAIVTSKETRRYSLPELTPHDVIATLDSPPLNGAISAFLKNEQYMAIVPRGKRDTAIAKYALTAETAIVERTRINDSFPKKLALGPSGLVAGYAHTWNSANAETAPDKTIRTWRNKAEISSRSFYQNLFQSIASSSEPKEFCFTNDGSTLLVSLATHDAAIVAYNVDDFSEKFRLEIGRNTNLSELALSPTDKYVATADQSGQILVFDLISQRPYSTFQTELEAQTVSIAFSADESRLAIKGRLAPRSQNEIMDIQRASRIFIFDLHTKKVVSSRDIEFGHALISVGEKSFAFSHFDHRKVEFIGPGGNTTHVWPIQEDIREMAVSPTEPVLACSTFDGDIFFWDLEHRTPLGRLSLKPKSLAQQKSISELRFSDDGKQLRYITGGTEGTIRLDIAKKRVQLNRPRNQAF